MTKNTLVALAALVLPAVLVSASAQKEGTAGAAAPVTYQWMVSERPDAPVKEDWPVVLELEKRTGVDLQFIPVPSESFAEKRRILIATSEVPDLMQGTHKDAVNYGPDGVFLGLKKLLMQGAPNIRKLYEEIPDAWVAVTSVKDQEVYGVPDLNLEPGQFDFMWMARRDLMVKHGIKAPKSDGDFYAMLKAFKQHYPASFPLTTRNFSGTNGLYHGVAIAFLGLNATNGVAWDRDSKSYKLMPEQPGFRPMLEYLNRLYSEKLLDPEFAVLTTNQWQARILDGTSFVTFGDRARQDTFTDTARSATPGAAFDLFAIEPWAAATGKKYVVTKNSVLSTGATVFSTKIKQPERAIAMLDYIHSPEGRILMNYGVEGISYRKEGDKYTAIGKFAVGGATGVTELRLIGAAMDGFRKTTVAEMWGYPPRIMERDALIVPFLVAPTPIVPPTDTVVAVEKENAVNVEQHYIQEVTKFIMGRTPISDETLAAFLREYKRLGADKMATAYNEAYRISRQ